jgi:hypothetical protein
MKAAYRQIITALRRVKPCGPGDGGRAAAGAVVGYGARRRRRYVRTRREPDVEPTQGGTLVVSGLRTATPGSKLGIVTTSLGGVGSPMIRNPLAARLGDGNWLMPEAGRRRTSLRGPRPELAC